MHEELDSLFEAIEAVLKLTKETEENLRYAPDDDFYTHTYSDVYRARVYAFDDVLVILRDIAFRNQGRVDNARD